MIDVTPTVGSVEHWIARKMIQPFPYILQDVRFMVQQLISLEKIINISRKRLQPKPIHRRGETRIPRAYIGPSSTARAIKGKHNIISWPEEKRAYNLQFEHGGLVSNWQININ